ncbi:hypothetical protein [Streptomyces sp. RTd22]|uniref:hypothetical protein n=1 Tax=Streptomyces sp. RTd22 TaxID=1841249 RepID=UPI0007C4E7EA|nr:hypothetical protein [Streptomyces sp. RTd22]
MPHRYRCPVCAIRSRPYWTRAGAQEHGRAHRRRYHGGDHPDGERIVYAPVRRLERGELAAVLIVVALLAVALVQRLV